MLEEIVHQKMKTVINSSPSCCFKPVWLYAFPWHSMIFPYQENISQSGAVKVKKNSKVPFFGNRLLKAFIYNEF